MDIKAPKTEELPSSDRTVEDPLGHMFQSRFLIFLFFLVLVLLLPFDIYRSNGVQWVSGSNGIEFVKNGMAVSPSPPTDLYQKLVEGQGLTLGIWLAPANISQSGPARIVSYSYDPFLRNFTLGQDGKKLAMRLRTNRTTLNGTKPSLAVDNVFASTETLHIAVTYDYVYQTIFINGQKRIKKKLPGGKFTNWDPKHYLIMGNEASLERPWRGKIFGVRLYNRSLEPEEVFRSYESGLSLNSETYKPEDLVVEYRFDESDGKIVKNHVVPGGLTDLSFPTSLHRLTFTSPYLQWPHDDLEYTLNSRDTALNVFGFIPFGFLLHGLLRNRRGLSWRISLIVLLAGALLSFSVETWQHFSIRRHSSSIDLVANTLGTVFGIVMDRSYIRHVRQYWKVKQQS